MICRVPLGQRKPAQKEADGDGAVWSGKNTTTDCPVYRPIVRRKRWLLLFGLFILMPAIDDIVSGAGDTIQLLNTRRSTRRIEMKDETNGVTRRDFIKKTGITVGAGALVGSQMFPGALQAKEIPTKWDQEADVVIVGSGYAGLAAAIEAYDAGSSVVILEKSKMVGGNSAISSGGYNAVDPERQKKQGIEDSLDLHYKQTLEGGDFRGNPENVRYYVENALDGVHWLEKLGVEFEPTVYTIVGALWPRSHGVANSGRGAAIINIMKKHVDERKIAILKEHKITGLLREKPLSGSVCGVEVDYKGKTLNVKAKKAVILATGGFAASPEMRSRFDPRLTADVPTTNVPDATGEAILYAEDIGADVVGMDYIQGLIACNYFTKKYGSLANLGIDHAAFVNLNGERFVAEDQRRDVMAEGTLVQPKKVLLWIADDQCKKRFNAEKTEQFLEKGLIFRSDTIEGLAKILKEKFDVPAETFLATIRKYNEYVAAGKDTDFDKRKENLKPIEKGPFWASPTQVGVHHTMGGVCIKGPSCQVIDRWGEIIPRLYAAGEVTGGIHGTNRLGGNATGDCIVFGRTAGKTAAAEKVWG